VSSRGRSRREFIREAFSAIAAYESCVKVAAGGTPRKGFGLKDLIWRD